MKPAKTVIGLAAMTALFVVAGVKASDPVGVYAMVERAVFAPSESAPKTVQQRGITRTRPRFQDRSPANQNSIATETPFTRPI